MVFKMNIFTQKGLKGNNQNSFSKLCCNFVLPPRYLCIFLFENSNLKKSNLIGEFFCDDFLLLQD